MSTMIAARLMVARLLYTKELTELAHFLWIELRPEHPRHNLSIVERFITSNIQKLIKSNFSDFEPLASIRRRFTNLLAPTCNESKHRPVNLARRLQRKPQCKLLRLVP